MGRDALTVPLIAARAGVTPSTVYRRWGDLRELLSDVAVERLRPDGPPADHGSLRADLEAWAVQFSEEMASMAGRTYIRDALLGDPEQGNAVRCSDYAAEQLKAIGVRAAGRGEGVPDVETLLDVLVAPSCTAFCSAPRICRRPTPTGLWRRRSAGAPLPPAVKS